MSISFKLGVAYEEAADYVSVIGLEKLKLTNAQDYKRVAKCGETEYYSKFIAIQEMINNKPVKIVKRNAFAKTQVEGVSLPKSIKIIESNAFRDCTALKSLIISDGLTRIESNAFRNCTDLRVVQLPKSVKFIGNQAFQNCESLELMKFSEGLEEIGSEALRECYSLKTVTLPKSLRKIGYGVFMECSVFLRVEGRSLSERQRYGGR